MSYYDELADEDQANLAASKERRAQGAMGLTRDERDRFAIYLRRKRARQQGWEPMWESWLR